MSKIIECTCENCQDSGWVCESHENKPWGGMSAHPDACDCGGAGMPCPVCNEDLGRIWPDEPAERVQ